MIRGLAHVCFTVRDLDASEAFYRDQIGMSHAFDFINDQGVRHGVYLHAGERTFVELFVGEPARPGGETSYRHFCLEVDDFDATVAELRGRGVELSDPTLGSDDSWQCWTADPDGNRIELHGYTPDSRQAPWLTGEPPARP